MSISLVVIGILLLICFSAFSSAAEMAYSSCNLLRLENLRDEGSKRAAAAVKIAARFDDAAVVRAAGFGLRKTVLKRGLVPDFAAITENRTHCYPSPIPRPAGRRILLPPCGP